MNTIRKALIITALAVTLLVAVANAVEKRVPVPTTNAAVAPVKTGRVEANGINYYYEIYGNGDPAKTTPLLLLHGGLGSIGMLAPQLPALAQGRRVVAVDLQGHGRTPLGDRKISIVDIGDDLATILKQLNIEQADVMGYSMGGVTAFRLAVQHPQMVRRLVMISAGYAQDGFYPEMLPQQAAVGAAMAEQMKETPMYKSYVAVAPHPEDFPKLLDAMGEWMRTPYNWEADVKKLTMPVMLIFADSDMYRPEHEIKFYQLLGGGLHDAGWQRENMSKNRLAILPGLTHYDIFMSPELAHTAIPFLNGEANATNWSDQVPEKK